MVLSPVKASCAVSALEGPVSFEESFRARGDAAKVQLRAKIVSPEHDIFAPRMELGGRSAMSFACFAANAEDLGDGDFCYEVAEGIADLRVLLARAPQDPESAMDAEVLTWARERVASFDADLAAADEAERKRQAYLASYAT